jgi:hypothetical protein
MRNDNWYVMWDTIDILNIWCVVLNANDKWYAA